MDLQAEKFRREQKLRNKADKDVDMKDNVPSDLQILIQEEIARSLKSLPSNKLRQPESRARPQGRISKVSKIKKIKEKKGRATRA
ncbi:unnamed protein product [Blumeria hordei]|uniref:Uncharacterized protein n=1 Tax=Blumeria hordei TaxID=2867405 RepID=A0A383V3Q8_BLUHO|nr:unnamed protein product [Blumeria hordei]